MARPTDMSSCSTSTFDYLYPEILPKHTLISVLKERHVKKSDEFDSMDKSQLVAHYNEYVLPLQQRSTGQSRRWNRLFQKIKKRQRQKRKLETADDGCTEDGNEVKLSKLQINNSTTVIKNSRLKPAPITTVKSNNKIRLDGRNRHAKSNNGTKLSQELPKQKSTQQIERYDKSPTDKKHQRITWP